MVNGQECQECPKGFYRGSSDTNPKRCLACSIGKMTRSEGAISCDTAVLERKTEWEERAMTKNVLEAARVV